MSCFFPSIFKKNTYKKVRFFFVSAFVILMALLFSGCNAIKSVVSFPLRVIGAVGEKIAGEDTKTSEKPLEGVSGGTVDSSDATLVGNENVINFASLVLWGIMLVAFAMIIRALVNRYVATGTKK